MTAPPRFRHPAPDEVLDHSAKRVANLRTIAGAVAALVVLAVTATMAWARVAQKADVDKSVSALEERVVTIEKKQAAVEAMLPLILGAVTRIEALQIGALTKE